MNNPIEIGEMSRYNSKSAMAHKNAIFLLHLPKDLCIIDNVGL